MIWWLGIIGIALTCVAIALDCWTEPLKFQVLRSWTLLAAVGWIVMGLLVFIFN
jgi:hypothetical protein